jgi:hypothetical protein
MATTTSLLDAALDYASRGWPVFPCRGKQPWIAKADGGHGFQDATLDPAQIRRWWSDWPEANIGMPTGAVSNTVVLDVDPAKGGRAAIEALCQSYVPLPPTMQSFTGGGGVHYFFLHPGEALQNSASRLGPGLDIRGDGGYVILPPSRHPSGPGRQYEWEFSSGPGVTVAECPAWILAVLKEAAPKRGARAGEAIPHGQRNATLARLAGSMRRIGWSADAICAALLQENATQCDPPLADTEVRQIAESVGRYAPAPQHSHAHASAPQTSAPATPWRDILQVKKNGDPLATLGNIGLILHHHEQWAGKFWWDAVRSLPMCESLPLTKESITEIAQWLGTSMRMGVSTIRPVEECLAAECQRDKRDLLQHWLNALPPWDGVPRLDKWLVYVAGVPNDAYGRAISRVLPLSMVARAMEPGCLYRYVVILEGPENTGKSSLVRALASEWYGELSIGLESKEAHMMLQGVWLAEMAELDSLTRTEETRLKAFITMTDDTWIPKYSNFKVSNPRRTIFIGTTNEESYLKGQQGNTRFLPIKTTDISIPLLLDMREQLFAEALQVYTASLKSWWQLPEDAEQSASVEREKRRAVNVFEPTIQAWLDTGLRATRNETTWAEIAEQCLQITSPERWKDISLQKQIATAMKALGWRNTVVKRQGKATRVWAKEVTPADGGVTLL